jgi:hypothetical protein
MTTDDGVWLACFWFWWFSISLRVIGGGGKNSRPDGINCSRCNSCSNRSSEGSIGLGAY